MFPLTEATKYAAPCVITWNTCINGAFEYVYNVLSALLLPTEADVFLLQTDTSGRGVGAVHSVCRDGLWVTSLRN